MYWIIAIVVFLALFVWIGITGQKKEKKNVSKMAELGYLPELKIITGKYVGGHPDINEMITTSCIFPKGNGLDIMQEILMEVPLHKGTISKEVIKNVIVEDQSTMEKRVTLGRLLTVGIFAIAWQKSKKVESAYLIIEWADGRFDHETIFEFSGSGAMQKANTARNGIIKALR